MLLIIIIQRQNTETAVGCVERYCCCCYFSLALRGSQFFLCFSSAIESRSDIVMHFASYLVKKQI